MEIFHECFKYTPSNLSYFLVSLYNLCKKKFADKCLKIKLLCRVDLHLSASWVNRFLMLIFLTRF